MEKQNSSHITTPLVCDFLLYLFNEGYASSSLNSARSALSFFSNSENLASDPHISRLFKYFYRERPRKAKYITHWPVSQVLNFLKSWHPPSSISLKKLTLKTLALIAISSSDRGQTLHLLNINKVHLSPNKLSFVITDRLKTTKRVLKPKVVTCYSSICESLSPFLYIKEYLSQTSKFRKPNDSQLFLSWASKRPVTKATIARWLKTVLYLSGIDTKVFSAHSFRGASLSSAYTKGVSISDIMSAGDWKQAETFFAHYYAPASNTPVGQIILSQHQPSSSQVRLTLFSHFQNNVLILVY